MYFSPFEINNLGTIQDFLISHNFFFQQQHFFQFFMYCKAKKKIRSDPKIFDFFLFSKGGISIDADSGPPRYVL